ncbi:MAG: hypothetical protein KKI12_10985 [Proteobacteria bacterium]|nr:hypothetical protein [Pseudomonadota bacterium]
MNSIIVKSLLDEAGGINEMIEAIGLPKIIAIVSLPVSIPSRYTTKEEIEKTLVFIYVMVILM